MSSTLMLHRGARVVNYDELQHVLVPDPTDTWVPVSHARIFDETREQLQNANFEVTRTQLALSRNDQQFFGVMDLRSSIATGVTLAVAIRNSIDKTLPMAFVAGNRTFCCDNLSLRSDLMQGDVKRKHSRFGADRFREALSRATMALPMFAEAETQRLRHFQYKEITDDTADALMLRAYERGVVSHYLLPRVIQEYREPSFDYGVESTKTLLGLENAFTTVLSELAKKSPQRFCAVSLLLQNLLSQAAGFAQDVPAVVPAVHVPA